MTRRLDMEYCRYEDLLQKYLEFGSLKHALKLNDRFYQMFYRAWQGAETGKPKARIAVRLEWLMQSALNLHNQLNLIGGTA